MRTSQSVNVKHKTRLHVYEPTLLIPDSITLSFFFLFFSSQNWPLPKHGAAHLQITTLIYHNITNLQIFPTKFLIPSHISELRRAYVNNQLSFTMFLLQVRKLMIVLLQQKLNSSLAPQCLIHEKGEILGSLIFIQLIDVITSVSL